MRKVDVPRVRRNIRALRHVAQVAQIALVDDLGEVALRDLLHLAAFRGVYEIEQRGKSVAQVDAAAAAVADVEDALELAVERGFVVVVRVAPVDRMARRRFETTFAGGHGLSAASARDAGIPMLALRMGFPRIERRVSCTAP